MKKRLKIFAYLTLTSLLMIVVFSTSHDFSNSYSKIKLNLPTNTENRSLTQVGEIIESVKAPTYYTVFNVILNYLPLNK